MKKKNSEEVKDKINWDLENNARVGIQERASFYTVAIDISLCEKKPSIATGTLIRIGGRSFIATCKHVVSENCKNEMLRFFFKPGKSLGTASKDEIKKLPLHKLKKLVSDKSCPTELSIINRFYSNKDDLVLLEIDAMSEEAKKYEFYDLSDRGIINPDVDKPIYLIGFPSELARLVSKTGIGIFPYFIGTKLSDKNVELQDFDPVRHLLIEFSIDDDSVEPHGLSGCGVWTRLPSGDKNLWTPNIYLVGIQSGFFRNSQLLIATKADKILELIS